MYFLGIILFVRKNHHYLFRVANYGASTEYVSFKEYREAQTNFKENLQKDSYYQSRKIPISLKETKDYIGKCFILETDEIATLDQQYQGEFIFLLNCFYRTKFGMVNIFITKFGV